MSTPLITIFVRHAAECKYKGDEFEKRCRCRKHLRWTANGTQQRLAANTRSWAEAEQAKRGLEDQLAGRTPQATLEAETGRGLSDCIRTFIKDKTVQGITKGRLGQFERELNHFEKFCATKKQVYVAQGITRELLTDYCATWAGMYASSTQSRCRERLSQFLRYAHDARWIPYIPALPRIRRTDERPTMPLTQADYETLLNQMNSIVNEDLRKKVRGIVQLMRYSGLAVRDASTLAKSGMIYDRAKGIYRVVTKRQKTGTDVSVPLPPAVAAELLAVPNAHPGYFFWDPRTARDYTATGRFGMLITRCFERAGLNVGGNLKSHRLRDTFAVDLLEKGVPLEEVSKLLGHESIRTTEESYAKWVKGRQDRLDNLVVGTW